MGTERTRELRRRRHRSKQVTKLVAKAEKANAADKAVLITKLRRMTPGAEAIIKDRGLEG
ncbi:MAG: DUF6800 family protein [Pirellulaceae bacterium]